MKFSQLEDWVNDIEKLCQPAKVYWCDGSEREWREICEDLVKKGTLIRLNPLKRPDSFLARSSASDVARVEKQTFICSPTKKEAGPTNNWKDPQEMRTLLKEKFQKSMQGRTMYVIPFRMGPKDSKLCQIGIQITDSAYVAVNMRAMTQMGRDALNQLKEEEKEKSHRLSCNEFIPCLHSVGAPLKEGQEDVAWPCNEKKYIVHFTKEKEIWSYGSGYGGNALLGKKCLSLRIASTLAKEECWMAEHMLILRISKPDGEKFYIGGAFPSACGKTNLAMLIPPEFYLKQGWQTGILGDDIAWIYPHEDGTLRALNPEAGYFGVAPGTSMKTNPRAMKTISKNTIFTNVALTDDNDVWWEGMTEHPPEKLTDWEGNPWTPNCGREAAHPNSRFTVMANQCPSIDSAWTEGEGVPLTAIIFGGRRPNTMPLVYETENWQHGVYTGAMMGSEMTAAAEGDLGEVRRDPMAILPFGGYDIGEYFSHWLDIGKKIKKQPKIFHVNWFRKDNKGNFLWPGFGENIRVLEWILNRCQEKITAIKSFIGFLPSEINIEEIVGGNQEKLQEALSVNKEEWMKEMKSRKKYIENLNIKLPKQLWQCQKDLEKRLAEK